MFSHLYTDIFVKIYHQMEFRLNHDHCHDATITLQDRVSQPVQSDEIINYHFIKINNWMDWTFRQWQLLNIENHVYDTFKFG